MPVTLTVETGAVVEGANTYVDLDTQKAFLESHPYGAAVLAMGDDKIAAGMVLAFRSLNVAAVWKGALVNWDQDGAFPREDLDPVPNNVIPKGIKQAQMEYLRFVLTTDRDAEADGAAVKREKVDVIEIEYQIGAKRDLVPEIVQRLISPFVQAAADDAGGGGTSGPPAATGVRMDRV